MHAVHTEHILSRVLIFSESHGFENIQRSDNSRVSRNRFLKRVPEASDGICVSQLLLRTLLYTSTKARGHPAKKLISKEATQMKQ